jgi:catechol 2,3-dioxygenase-like lactoylglutathione lyase family enzyme
MASMLGDLDHVGYLAADLEASVAEVEDLFGLTVARRFERPQFSLVGVYMGSAAQVELFSFTDEELVERRLGTGRLILDHVAYRVEDIEETATAMHRAGVRFAGPDLRTELHAPVDLGGVLHLWTLPETSAGQMIQLMQV